MLASLLILAALAASLQHYLGDFYLILAIHNRLAQPGLDLSARMESAMRGTGIALVLSTVGIWAIKLNFLTFFRRFGAQIRAYMVAWWVACFLVVASAVAQIGIIPYSCLFTSWTGLLTKCETDASLTRIYASYKASIALDVISDVVSKSSLPNHEQIEISQWHPLFSNLAMGISQSSAFPFSSLGEP